MKSKQCSGSATTVVSVSLTLGLHCNLQFSIAASSRRICDVFSVNLRLQFPFNNNNNNKTSRSLPTWWCYPGPRGQTSRSLPTWWCYPGPRGQTLRSLPTWWFSPSPRADQFGSWDVRCIRFHISCLSIKLLAGGAVTATSGTTRATLTAAAGQYPPTTVETTAWTCTIAYSRTHTHIKQSTHITSLKAKTTSTYLPRVVSGALYNKTKPTSFTGQVS